MLTTKIAGMLYTKLCKAPPEWFRSKEGKALVAKATDLVREKCGDAEAETFANLLTLAEVC
jgi:hypothetical protein